MSSVGTASVPSPSVPSAAGPDPAPIGAGFTRLTVEAAGFTVSYFEAGMGVPLVVLPGAGGPRFSPALDLLAAEFRVLLFELPGWGDQPNDVADFDGLAGQVAAAVAALGLDTYHLLGTSLGGACALHLATLFPDRIISLTLEAPAKFRVDSRDPATLAPEEFLAAFRTHPDRGLPMTPPDPAFLARVWPLVGRLMTDVVHDESFAQRLTGLPTRTLILFGTDDGVINPVNGRIYRRLLGNSALIQVYDAAHDIQNDRAEAFADVVGDFIRRGMNFLLNDTDRLINP